MKKIDDFMEELRKDAEIPDNVETRFEETLSGLGTYKAKKKFGAAWVKAAAIAGAVIVGGTAFCYTNPVIAAKLPIIGKIFEQVENQVDFSGKYANKETLQDDENSKSEYTAKSNGVTIKASEIYSDGYSIFLTTEIKVEKGGMNNVEAVYTSRFGETTSQYLYTEGKWDLGDTKSEKKLMNNYIEGKSVNDNTFVGMIKLDKDSYSVEDGKINISLTSIGYDDKNKRVLKNEYDDNKVDINGNWELSIPYSVDRQNSKEIVVNKKNKDGYGIKKVFVSPYQVVVFNDVPYTKLNPKEYTKEDFEKDYGEKNEQVIADGYKPTTYEDILNEKHYNDWELAIFDKNGKPLTYEEANGRECKEIFSVKGLDVSKLHIYMGDGTSGTMFEKAKKEADVKDKAILDVVVDVK